MSDIWVVNASPVIVLAKADRLPLLERSCRELVMPEAVVAERSGQPGTGRKKWFIREFREPEEGESAGSSTGSSSLFALSRSGGIREEEPVLSLEERQTTRRFPEIPDEPKKSNLYGRETRYG